MLVGFEHDVRRAGSTRRGLERCSVLGIAAWRLDVMGGQTTNVELDAAQISALNPLMVMIIIPLLNVLVYRPLEKRGKPSSRCRR